MSRTKKALRPGTDTTMAVVTLVVTVLLVALPCVSGTADHEASAFKDQVPPTGSESEKSRPRGAGTALPELRASIVAGTAQYGSYRRNNCSISHSFCLNPRVPGNACCGSSCIDLNSHPRHCGKCNHSCKAGRDCCNGKCKCLTRNRNHCGACNKKCSGGSHCAYGLCGY